MGKKINKKKKEKRTSCQLKVHNYDSTQFSLQHLIFVSPHDAYFSGASTHVPCRYHQ